MSTNSSSNNNNSNNSNNTRTAPTNEDLEAFYAHFEEHGWAVLKNAIPAEMADKAREEISETLLKKWKFDTRCSSTWGNWPFANNGMCELFHLPSFYAIRFYEPLYHTFSRLYQTHKLRVTIDRCCVKRPHSIVHPKTQKVVEKPEWKHSGFWHHDMNLVTGYAPIPIQSVISLDDTEPNEGGWQGFDKFHRLADYWLKSEKAYAEKISNSTKVPVFFPNPEKFKSIWVRPHMGKGDLCVWKSQITHGNCSNESVGKLRWAIYPNYVAAEDENPQERFDYIESWSTGKHPGRFDSKWSKLEMEGYKPYPLESLLEQQLMGLEGYD